MKTLKRDIDVVCFLNTVSGCKGEVWFCTKAGDRINLKSELSKYLFVTVIGNKELLRSGQVIIEEKQDEEYLAPFLSE